MKRALVLTHDYPPCSAPGAALRSQKLVQYLPGFGWEVTVIGRLDARSGDAADQTAAGADVIRVRPLVPERVSYQLGAWTWARRMLPRAAGIVRAWRPDVVYASCPPFAHALPAVRLARDARIPAVIDFRDAWSLDPYVSGGRLKQAAKQALCRWVFPPMERRVIESAAAVVMNTPSMHREYGRLYPEAASRMHLVPNGFDEADFDQMADLPLDARPHLLYCGRFTGVGGRSPDVLLRGVRAAIDAGRRFDLDILGDDSAALRDAVRRAGIHESVRQRGLVSHREAIRAMRRADILVVYQAPGRSAVTAVAGKTFEYLRSGRPILAIVPPGDNADLVRRFASVHAIVTDEDPAHVARAIGDLLDQAARSGESAAPDPAFVATYSRRRIAGDIAAILDAVRDAAASGGPAPR
jgi:glycosyltransferase involved in cell wall biosynthesis